MRAKLFSGLMNTPNYIRKANVRPIKNRLKAKQAWIMHTYTCVSKHVHTHTHTHSTSVKWNNNGGGGGGGGLENLLAEGL